MAVDNGLFVILLETLHSKLVCVDTAEPSVIFKRQTQQDKAHTCSDSVLCTMLTLIHWFWAQALAH